MNCIFKKVFPYSLVVLLLTFVGCQEKKSIVILHDNDVHCAADGYGLLAGYKQAILAADTAFVATVSSGDFLQGASYGSVSRGEYIIDFMNAVGYDVVTLGNHEFDYGTERMHELLGRLDAEVVDANLTLPGSYQTVFAPYTIRRFGDKQIAFVGATTPGTVISEAYSFYDREGKPLLELHEADIVEVLQRAVDDARAAGADYVILLSHLGDVAVLSKVNTTDLIPQMSGVDVVFDAHTHNLIPERRIADKEGKEVILTMTGTAFSHIGQLTIFPDGTMRAECRPREEFEGLSTEAFDSVKVRIDQELTDIIEKEVTYAPFPLFANDDVRGRIIRKEETNLGDFVADALRVVTDAHIGIINGGGVRSDIKKGSVKHINANDVLPFGNKVVMLELTGKEITDLLEWTSRDLPAMSGSFLQVSGIRYHVDERIKNRLSVDKNRNLIVEGRRRVRVEIQDADGKWCPIAPKNIYKVATIDFISNTGKAFPTLASVKLAPVEELTDDEVLIRYMQMMGKEVPEKYRTPHGEGRIIIVR